MPLSRLGLVLALGCSAGLAHADTLRCGSQLVSLGDRSFEVQQKCGEPVLRDLIGYGLGPNERREYLIEEWVYGPSNGMLTILTFEGNRLTHIERRRDN
ncbi:DUF2845 domain-containing protein [Pseudomonas zhanjiangensis]|uniref:DUF2845 domain-containing protein n=1 Tax=Pseudomonas zhanjiangensis TaxID=3239015 RepID=A0ABV3YYU1_9PSED